MEKPKKTDKKPAFVPPPPAINPHLMRRHRVEGAATGETTEQLVEGIRAGNPVLLGKAITLIESQHPTHQAQAQEVVAACLPESGNSIRLGITGSPGVGKSTFIEAFGMALIERGAKVAVLAIDPSSQVSKGSILGDKTRMQELSGHPSAFIRPSAAGNSLGGVARKTRETILLCEVAGYNHILIETVGVGQSEIAVHSMVDFFILLLLPGAGDELQGIKRGIVEMADLLLINKSDGERIPLAKKTKRAYSNAIHLFPLKESRWQPKVLTCSSTKKEGLADVHSAILEFLSNTKDNHYFQEHRRQQAHFWLMETIRDGLQQAFYEHPAVKAELKATEEKVLNGLWTSYQAARHLLGLFQENS